MQNDRTRRRPSPAAWRTKHPGCALCRVRTTDKLQAVSELHLRQIRAAIQKTFDGKIDLADVASRPLDEQETASLTRGQAAFALSYVGKIKPEDSARAITDGGQDNGLDAIYYDPAERILYLVQSKWRSKGTGSIDRGEIQKFLKGVNDLLNARWERFNPKISGRAPELDAALDDSKTRIVLLLVYTGQEPLAPEIAQDLADALEQLNDPAELVATQVLRQGDLYAAVAHGLEGAPINLDVALYDWGQVREPYVGFYGQVSASDVAGWYLAHQSRLLAPNIRLFLGSTEVNETLLGTLLSAPHDFWYFNNGITALCRSLQKKPIGGSSRETGVFACQDLRIVNGAQTVGAIAQAFGKNPAAVAQARVSLRMISLEECPPEFDRQVTRYTNTQNRIDRRDFVALDPEQERLRGELQLEGITYTFKSGDILSDPLSGFDLVEATVARACQQAEVALAVQAKREIGRLWDDITRPPYKVLFNSSVSGPALWRAVQVVRRVEQLLVSKRTGAEGRKRLLAVHGNRFIAHAVFSRLQKAGPQPLQPLTTSDEAAVEAHAGTVYDESLDLINRLFPEAYLASLFKNASKCQQLKDGLDALA